MSLKDDRRSIANKTAIERDVERTITDLLVGKEVKEPVRTAKKIIKTADSETTITYELQVNPQTGQQEVVEHITTTKKECAICGGYFAQIAECEDCHVRICAKDSADHSCLQKPGESSSGAHLSGYCDNCGDWADTLTEKRNKFLCSACTPNLRFE